MVHELSAALADYLSELHRLSQAQATVLSADVATALGVSKASACRATDSLCALGYIQKQRYVKGITLTTQGRAYAEFLTERRAVIAAFLQKTLRLEVELAQRDAKTIAHGLSEKAFLTMCLSLN